MQQYSPRYRVMAIALILATGMAGFGGCATGAPLSQEDFASLLSGAQDIFNLFMAVRTELDALESQPDANKPNDLARLEAEAVRLWNTFETLRDLVEGRARTGTQKALIALDLYMGPMPTNANLLAWTGT